MSEITDRIDQFIEYAEKTRKFADVGFYSDCKAEITTLRQQLEQAQARVAELEAEEEGAKEAFGVIVEKSKGYRDRIAELEKTVGRQIAELSRLYRIGARPMHDDIENGGG